MIDNLQAAKDVARMTCGADWATMSHVERLAEIGEALEAIHAAQAAARAARRAGR
jgi:hypothetical protein